jgi:protocatechuate 3,4-dioxygenase beta subunit
MITFHAHVISLLMIIQSVTVPPAAPKVEDEASIEGMVVTSVSGDPLRKAQVTLTQVRPPSEVAEKPRDPDSEPERFPPITPITTGADGKFKFTKIAPGSYRLSVACNGFVSTDYGKKSAGGQGTIITLTSAQSLKDVLFRLQPAGLVTGHVHDSEGQPMTGMFVGLLKTGYSWTGSRTMMTVASGTTDDRGEYRLYWVSPGRYYLSATAGDLPFFMFNRTGNMVQEKNLPPTYFPGVLDLAHAAIIDVAPAAELNAMDITVTKPPTFKVKGTVVDSSTGSTPKNVEVFLVPRSENEPLVDEKFSIRGGGDNYHFANGVFEVTNVIPGSYTLRVSGYPDWNAPLDKGAVASVRTASDLYGVAFNRATTAEIPIDVSAADVTGLKVALAPGERLTLKVSLNGNDISTFPDFEKLRVNLIPVLRDSDDLASQQGPLTAEGNGTIEKVGNGRYRVRMEHGTPDIYIKEATFDNADALNGYLQINGPPAGSLRIVLGDKPGRVDGTLTDSSSKPVAGVQVILIPEKVRFRDELYKFADTDEKGHFSFRSIPPGDYRVFAWESLEPFEYFDPDLLSRYEQQGRFVHVTESSQESIDIRLISRQ